ncbi:uncharacterized membrane protein (DUF485 family) [Paraburkholderia sp. BL6665CI2N2]|uniref:DUF485 domain-containing protein n=1 Tax=Paraburkholderia sp. BL6665CI2N2 TaxID=1938806 RepID=UPI001066A394|nr:DUF485 domain-containing protein [Paraburkholderia sp. BL6665CI2N2]TDY23031.1 uncharacterized membrane protein (DUF485 family) [Paraburkholderia sp. BL6665CI2N2]
MQQAHIESIQASPAYRRLIASRRRFSFTLTALMIATYYGFILFVAVAPHLLARPLYAGATTTIGVLVGVCIIAVAITLTAWYVLHANRSFDPSMRALLVNASQESEA